MKVEIVEGPRYNPPMTLAEAIAVIDEAMNTRDLAVRDSWRIVRGDLRRSARRPSSTLLAAVEEEETPTARQRFAHATEDLVKVREEIDDRKGRGDGG